MFEQTIALIEEKLGMTPEEGHKVEFNEEALSLELDLLKNIKCSVLEMEVTDDTDSVDPVETFKSDPNILFFRTEEAGFLNAAIQSKKLIDQLIHLNVPHPQPEGFDLGQILGNLHPQSEDEENPEIVDAEESNVVEFKPAENDSEVVESEIAESNEGENTEE